MAGPVYHSAKIRELAQQFLIETETEVIAARKYLEKSAEFSKIYKTSLAAEAVPIEITITCSTAFISCCQIDCSAYTCANLFSPDWGGEN